MSVTVILATAVLILYGIFVAIGNKTKKSPPGPFPWPFFGSLSFFKRLTIELGAQHLAFLELCKRYNSDVVTLCLGSSKVVVVSGNKCVDAVLRSEDFDGRPWNEFIKLRNLGKRTGITMNDGADWRVLRMWMVSTLKTFGFGRRTMSEMIKDELVVILDTLKAGGVMELKPVMTPAVINVLWSLTTGKRFCEGPKLEYFISLMDRRTRAFDMLGGILTAFPWIRYIAPEASGYNLLATVNRELKDFLLESIIEHKKNYVAGSESDMIDMFLRDMTKNKEATALFNDDQLMMVLIDLFLAAFTTTGISLDFLFVNMVVHQDVQKKLHKEIDSVITSDRLPDLEDRPKLPYAEAVITETLRRWTVFPVIGPRRVQQDTNLDRYTLSKGDTVLMNLYSVNMDPNLFPEPEKFKPERFLKNGEYHADKNVLIFGRGKRRCPGDALARAAVFLLFVGVMKKFSLLPVPGKGPNTIDIDVGLGISPKPYETLIVAR